MKKLLRVVGYLILSALIVFPVFASKGSKTSGTSAPVKKEKKVKLVIWEWISTQGSGPIYQKILQSYRDSHPNIEIESISDPWNQAHNKVLLMYQAHKMPDIIGVNRNWLMEFVSMGILEDLTPYVDSVPGMRDKYYDAVKGELNGKVWILPYAGGDAALIYNKDAFQKMGLTPPKTLDEFVKIGKKFSDPAHDKYATQWCMSAKNPAGANVCNFGPILTSFGGTYVRNKKAAFNDEAGVKAMEWMIKLEKEGIAAPGGTTVDAKGMREAFASGRIVMTFDGAWGVPFYNKFPNLKWGVARMPKGKDSGTVVNIMCWGISKESKLKKEAWDLLKYLESDKMLLKYFREGNVMPCTKKIGAMPEFQKKYKGFLETYAQTTNFFQTGSIPQESELYRLIVEAYQKAFSGEMTVKQALDEAAQKYNKILDNFYAKYKG